jgi:hypothetical protein
MRNNDQDEVIVIDDGGNVNLNATGPAGTAEAMEKPEEGASNDNITKMA